MSYFGIALEEHLRGREETLRELSFAVRIGMSADEKKWSEFIKG